MGIDYYAMPAEDIAFLDNSFDVITACRCFWYFEHETLMPKFFHMLKPGGYILVLYMAWLPGGGQNCGMGKGAYARAARSFRPSI